MTHIGSTFVLAGEGHHLRVVISKKNESDGLVLVCNLTDRDHDPDCLCKFEAGEHKRITKPSVVEMRKLIALPVDKFPEAVRRGHIVLREDFPVELVERIVTAVLKTKSVRPKFKAYLH